MDSQFNDLNAKYQKAIKDNNNNLKLDLLEQMRSNIKKRNKGNNKKQTLKTMKDMPLWKIEKIKDMSTRLPCRIFVESSDPDILKGLDQDKLASAKMANFPKYKKYLDEMDNKYQWTIVAAPSKAWAKKVFPDLDVKSAYNKLWEAILYTTRVSDDPIQEWKKHNEYLKNKCKKLNDYELVCYLLFFVKR